MPYIDVTLSDGSPCKVRRLSVFSLDGIGPVLPGPFRYKQELSDGQVVESLYDPSARSSPPEHPGVPEDEIVERSPTWWQLLEYETYKAAIAYETVVRLPATIQYIRDVSAYIADTCVGEKDRDRITTEKDWHKIYYAATVPQITQELLATAFKDHFAASFKEREIFDALAGLSGGHGKYDVFRQWEHDAMSEFGYKTEEEWSNLSLDERVRKVAKVALPSLMESLETDARIKEMEAKRGT